MFSARWDCAVPWENDSLLYRLKCASGKINSSLIGVIRIVSCFQQEWCNSMLRKTQRGTFDVLDFLELREEVLQPSAQNFSSHFACSWFFFFQSGGKNKKIAEIEENNELIREAEIRCKQLVFSTFLVLVLQTQLSHC